MCTCTMTRALHAMPGSWWQARSRHNSDGVTRVLSLTLTQPSPYILTLTLTPTLTLTLTTATARPGAAAVALTAAPRGCPDACAPGAAIHCPHRRLGAADPLAAHPSIALARQEAGEAQGPDCRPQPGLLRVHAQAAARRQWRLTHLTSREAAIPFVPQGTRGWAQAEAVWAAAAAAAAAAVLPRDSAAAAAAVTP